MYNLSLQTHAGEKQKSYKNTAMEIFETGQGCAELSYFATDS
jgi:hypothetical protein